MEKLGGGMGGGSRSETWCDAVDGIDSNEVVNGSGGGASYRDAPA